MQTYTQATSATVNSFITPQAMIQGLIASLTSPCNCGTQGTNCECEEEELNQEIKGLQVESSNIRAEVVEVEHLLQARDHLYSELDQYRQERDQIENEIENSMTFEQTDAGQSSGAREMNERLRRRIYEVREYIQKMTFENQKIEEGVISNQYMEREEEITIKRRDMQTHYPSYEGKRHLSGNIEAMVEKMHDRQEESLKRVRRQEEDIQRRNMESRMNMSSMESRSMSGRMRKTGMNNYYSPPARTFYSPNRQIY